LPSSPYSVSNHQHARIKMSTNTAVNPLYSGGTYGQILISALQRYPDRVAFESEHGSYTYAETALHIARAISRLKELGLKRGDTVAQLSGNRPETFFLLAAIYISGLRSVTLHTLGSLEDHAYIIEDSEAALLVMDPQYVERAQALRAMATKPMGWLSHSPTEGFEHFWTPSSAATLPLTSEVEPEDIIRL